MLNISIKQIPKRTKFSVSQADIRLHHAGSSKIYWKRLPDDLKQPMPDYEITSTELAIIFPVFLPYDALEDDKIPDFIKYSIYTRQSWLVNSDVIEKGIPVYYYIERPLYEQYRDYFAKQGVSDKFLIVHETDPTLNTRPEHTPQSKRLNFGKKLLYFFDNRFSGYDYTILTDVDCLLCKTANATAKYDILSEVRQMPRDRIGMFTTGKRRNNITSNWQASFIDREAGFLANLDKVFDAETAERLRLENMWVGNRAPRFIFSKDYIQREDFREFIHKSMSIYVDDEAMMGIWGAYAENSFYNIDYKDPQLPPYFTSLYEACKALDEGVPYYYLHFSNDGTHEAMWRSQIGDTPDD